MKKQLKIYVISPLGSCIDAKRLHLDKAKNDIVYNCPKCKEQYSYLSQYFGKEPYGKTIAFMPIKYPIVKTECEKCHYTGTFFVIKQLNEEYIFIEDGDFKIEVKSLS